MLDHLRCSLELINLKVGTDLGIEAVVFGGYNLGRPLGLLGPVKDDRPPLSKGE